MIIGLNSPGISLLRDLRILAFTYSMNLSCVVVMVVADYTEIVLESPI